MDRAPNLRKEEPGKRSATLVDRRYTPWMSKRIVLGVTGSIAAYRAADLASQLTKEGFELDVVLTDEALHFITALTFHALTRREVFTRENDGMREGQPAHISLADCADLVVIAPATAHLIAQLAHGLAPDLLTSLLLATPAPVVIAPAMNGKMWNHPATQANVELLQKARRGVHRARGGIARVRLRRNRPLVAGDRNCARNFREIRGVEIIFSRAQREKCFGHI